MSKNRKISKRRSAKKTALTSKTAPKRTRAARPTKKIDGDSVIARDVIGVMCLGSTIFLAVAVISLQAGGNAMGPFGRALAGTLYGALGVGSYLFIAGCAVASLRLLAGRHPAVPGREAGALGLILISIGSLAHLIGGSYRVSDSPAGGALGRAFAEVTRAVISTPGTVLLACVIFTIALVIATPLRMDQVTNACARVVMTIGRALGRTAKRVGSQSKEIVLATLPDKNDSDFDIDLEDENDSQLGWDEAEPAFASELDPQTAAEAATPEILDNAASDTERVENPYMGDGDDESLVLTKKKADKKPGKKTKSSAKRKTTVRQKTPGGPEIVIPPTVNMTLKEEPSAPAPVPETSDDGIPLIVESPFRSKNSEEIAEAEQNVEEDRLNFIPLGDGDYTLPPLALLNYDETQQIEADREQMLELSQRLVQTLEHYRIKGEVTAIRPGPVVTMYEFAPAPGTRLNKIVSLADDLAMALEALRVRIVAPIPGKAAVGIEVPNKAREMVYLKEIIADDGDKKDKPKLPLAMGKDIEGAPVVVDLAKMPHLLVAGTTGSGKSVSVNSMITSMLYACTPEQVRIIMVDPKMLELSIYEGIPHLLLPVVTDPKKASLALKWAVDEMERRYQLLSEQRVRDISSFNKKVVKLKDKYDAKQLQRAANRAAQKAEGITPDVIVGEADDKPPEELPYIVLIIDEFADLMMCAPKDVETSVARIAQKARAAGIHLILATQRPSVNVITGLIKANFPSRAAFHVTSKVDSRTILDQMGAERLLGAGDMLFSDRGAPPRRVHGCFVSEDEIADVVDHLKTQGQPVYNLDILTAHEEDDEAGPANSNQDLDAMYDQAVAVVQESRQVSISMVQRRLRVGYNRAARIVESMEHEGVISKPDHSNKREVLLPPAA